MAIHYTPASMLKESLDEILEAAKICIDYRKDNPKWGEYKTGGCLGYPAAILLFSLVDTVGSYYRKNKVFKTHIEGKKVSIDSDGWQHFKILNSIYFGQNLTTKFIQTLYTKFRSNLSHNSVLGDKTLLFHDEFHTSPLQYYSKAFATSVNKNGDTIHIVSLMQLYIICERGIMKFKADIDKVVPLSRQGKGFR
jgi:hypothetical protein